jgi:hypothetical protein
MSANEHGLLSSALLDCHGQITHHLTVLPDGKVKIATSGLELLIDPSTRVVLRPRGAHVPDQVMSCAVALAAELRPEQRH